MVALPSWLVSTDFGTIWSYQCSLSNFTPVSLHMLKCSWVYPPSCLFMYCSFACIGHADVMCSTVSSNCLWGLHLLFVAVCNIFVSLYLVCNAWSYAAAVSLLVSPFRSALVSHRNVFASLISCLSILTHAMHYWALPLFSLRTVLILLLCVECLTFLCHCFHLIGLILQLLMPF